MTSSAARRERRLKNWQERPLPKCPLICGLRPIQLSDMVPGVEYPQNLTILTLRTPPVFGETGDTGFGYDIPVALPAEHREPTEFNIRLALALVERTDPEAAAVIEQMKELARDPTARAFADHLNLQS